MRRDESGWDELGCDVTGWDRTSWDAMGRETMDPLRTTTLGGINERQSHRPPGASTRRTCQHEPRVQGWLQAGATEPSRGAGPRRERPHGGVAAWRRVRAPRRGRCALRSRSRRRSRWRPACPCRSPLLTTEHARHVRLVRAHVQRLSQDNGAGQRGPTRANAGQRGPARSSTVQRGTRGPARRGQPRCALRCGRSALDSVRARRFRPPAARRGGVRRRPCSAGLAARSRAAQSPPRRPAG
jgi:hypothetical protein